MKIMDIIPVLFIQLLVGCAGPKEEARRPNILFAISDDQSYHTSFLGTNYVSTPGFDRIATEGVFFTNAFVGSPACASSRSAIITGRHHWQNEQSGQHHSSWLNKHVPFVDLLANNGYQTGHTGKGISPFQFARNENDSLWREKPLVGPEYNDIRYTPGSEDDERPGTDISVINYFENFKYFIQNQQDDKPFFFWYGAREPHRPYEKNSWKDLGKNLKNVDVPPILPDNDLIRADLQDYAVEIEWFDKHLEKMIAYLEEIGELDNTIIIVTSDNGMPFVHAKSTTYDYGIHVPLAIRFPMEIPGNRIIEDVIGLIDIAPTILDFANTSHHGMLPITGRSQRNILASEKTGLIDEENKYAFSGRERQSSARHDNLGYPIRCIRSSDHLFIWNMKPDRWPVGAPQRANPDSPEGLYPMLGLDENDKYMEKSNASVFTDIAEGPTKTFLIENRNDDEIKPFFDRAFMKRPEYEFYDIKKDPFCLNNQVDNPEYMGKIKTMKEDLINELNRTNDPRVVGPEKEIFDTYLRYGSVLAFPKEVDKSKIYSNPTKKYE